MSTILSTRRAPIGLCSLGLIGLVLLAACTDQVSETPPDETGGPITLFSAEESSTTTTPAQPAARAHFCFWKVDLFNSLGVAEQFVHYFDVESDSTLNQLYRKAFNTSYYYPMNYASVYGYAYAVDTALHWTATTTRPQDTLQFEATGSQQTVTFTSAGSTQPDSAWSRVYVSHNADGAGYVNASVRNPYTDEASKRFYFSHCVTRISLKMGRSTNMTGDDAATVRDITVYAPKRCTPTQLDFDLKEGFKAVYADSTAEDAGDYSSTPSLTYAGQLPSGESIYVGSLYLLLDHYAPTSAGTLLPLQLKADYGTTRKRFNLTLSFVPDASKVGKYYLPGESYSAIITFDTDALILQTETEDWETGKTKIEIWTASSGTTNN